MFCNHLFHSDIEVPAQVFYGFSVCHKQWLSYYDNGLSFGIPGLVADVASMTLLTDILNSVMCAIFPQVSVAVCQLVVIRANAKSEFSSTQTQSFT